MDETKTKRDVTDTTKNIDEETETQGTLVIRYKKASS